MISIRCNVTKEINKIDHLKKIKINANKLNSQSII